MGDVARNVDVADGVFPLPEADRADVAFHVSAFAASLDEAAELAGMLGVSMGDFAAADRILLDHQAGDCIPGHRGWPCSRAG